MEKDITRYEEINNKCDRDIYELLLVAFEDACKDILVTKEQADALKALCLRLKTNDVISITSLIISVKFQAEHKNLVDDGEPFTAEKITIEEFIAKRDAYDQEKKIENR